MSENIKILAKKESGKTVLESILDSRGIFDKEAFLNPEKNEFLDPYSFSDMENAVEIINDAISKKENILIWGDFDADGVTSTAILCKTLQALGAKFSYFLPDRINLGHGVNLAELLTQKAKNNIKVLITVDCGISNVKEIELIKTMGVKTIITDHHQPPEILPKADCILNPVAPNSLKNTLNMQEIESLSYLSGAGVAMKLSYALLGDDFENIKKEILALAAVGTISDVVPLIYENRTIAAKGLIEINNKVNFGISKLFESQKINRKITSEDIAFILTPRINAAGRLDIPNTSIKLLLEKSSVVVDIAIKNLDALNKLRQSLCEKTYEEALDLLDRKQNCIVLFNREWHLGIIGIVASRLVERFMVPVFLISMDGKGFFRCSIRGTNGYDIAKILKSLKEDFTGYGGHAFAGGFCANSNQIDIDTLKEHITATVRDFSEQNEAKNIFEVDMEIESGDISIELVKELERMEPFGAKNKRPSFLFKDAVLESKKLIGRESNHLSFSVIKDNREFECVFWKQKNLNVQIGSKFDFVFHPEINFFNNDSTLRLTTEFILNDRLLEASSVKFFDHRQKVDIMPKIENYVAQKNGQVKVWAATIPTRKKIEPYSSIKQNLLTKITGEEKSIIMFDFPPCQEKFAEIIDEARPNAVHLMNADYIKNPDECITLVCGMLKFTANKKDGMLDIESLANAAGVDEVCIFKIIELLERAGSIKIKNGDAISFIKPPSTDILHKEKSYLEFKDEFKRVNDFKEYFKTADLASLKKLCNV